MDPSIVEAFAHLERAHWWTRARRRIVCQHIDTRFGCRIRLRVLEIGCATGENLRTLEHRGEVIGVEPSADLRHLGQRLGTRIEPGRLPDDLPLGLGEFDLILLLDVLEHVRDDVLALEVCSGLLRPGGSLLVAVPAAPWLWSGYDAYAGHHRRYTVGHLRTAGERAGLHLESVWHWNFVLFAPFAISRLWSKALRASSKPRLMVPPRPVNAFLEWCVSLEARWAPRVRPPWGSSIMGWMVQKPGVPAGDAGRISEGLELGQGNPER